MRIVFVGTGEITLPTLQWLLEHPSHHLVGVVTQPDKPAGRHQELAPPAAKEAVAHRFVPVFQPERIREPHAIEQIRFLRPDVLVTMAYGQILPEKMLRIPHLGALNLHASLLPRHRGASPIQAAILAGDSKTGVTVMWMDPGIDTGEILLQREIEIEGNDTGGSLHDRLAQLAPQALAAALQLIKSGDAPRTPQDENQASYCPKLNREAARIDWTHSAQEIERKIRALNPWPVAWTRLPRAGGTARDLKIYEAHIQKEPGEPGEVLAADKAGILAACGENALLLRDVQLAGKKRMTAGDFLLGTAVEPGIRLD